MYYSKVFNYVEIDSTFYRIPNEFMVKNWYKRTPDDFRFTAKFPKIITHDKRLSDFDEDQLNYFFESISELKEKLLALLIQLPPSMDIVEGLDALRIIFPYLYKRFRYAVEVRNRSWFQDLAYNFFRNNQMCLVWSQLRYQNSSNSHDRFRLRQVNRGQEYSRERFWHYSDRQDKGNEKSCAQLQEGF